MDLEQGKCDMLELCQKILPSLGHTTSYNFSMDMRESYIETLLNNILIHEALRRGVTGYEYKVEYEGSWEPLITIVEEFGGFCLQKHFQHDEDEIDSADYQAYIFPGSEKGFLFFNYSIRNRRLYLSITSLDQNFLNSLIEKITPLIGSETKEPGRVKMLCDEHGVYLREVGEIHDTFFPDNYTDEVANAYDVIRNNIESSTPNGRIYVLHGLPGTGKTHMIRALIANTKAVFIYIPQLMIQSLSTPHIFSVLIDEKADAPLVLIMEDADSSLITRGMDNQSQVSDILNMSDGLLGQLADIHIITTINAAKIDLDKALLRPGRMGVFTEFKELPAGRANSVLSRLLNEEIGKVPYCTEKVTLAEVYTKAREYGWTPPVQELDRTRRKKRSLRPFTGSPRRWDY